MAFERMVQAWALLPLLLATLSHCCTYFEVPQQQAGLVIGRAMELGDIVGPGKMDWRVVVHPRNTSAQTGTGKLGYVSIDGLGYGIWDKLPKNLTTLATEGMNEKGLSVSANTLHSSVYESAITFWKPKVLWWDVVPYLLQNFGTVKEAIEGLRKVAVIGGPQILCDEGACFHWALADSSNNSAIVEFTKGKMQVWEGPNQHVGVMTNDPPLDWQMMNLNQYINLRPDAPTSNAKIARNLDSGVVPRSLGHGYNLHGLPADVSPASRFVRMFYLREYAMLNYPQAVESKDRAITLATGLLNSAYLIKGTVAKSNALDALEYSPWAVIKIPREGLFLYRTASDMTWKQISLKNIDFLKGDHADIKLSDEELGIQDVTKLLSPTQLSSDSVV